MYMYVCVCFVCTHKWGVAEPHKDFYSVHYEQRFCTLDVHVHVSILTLYMYVLHLHVGGVLSFTARVSELILVLKDIEKGTYKRTMVTTAEATEKGVYSMHRIYTCVYKYMYCTCTCKLIFKRFMFKQLYKCICIFIKINL